MPTEQNLGERIKEFMHLADENDEPVRNHLSIRGSIADVEHCLKLVRSERADGAALAFDDRAVPVAFEDARFQERSGEWVTVLPGQAPERRTEHEEHAEAAFAFATDEPLDGAVAKLSEDHPRLEVRYAWLRHHGHGPDAARGGLWKAGSRVAECSREVEAVRADPKQLAELVREVDELDVAPQAA